MEPIDDDNRSVMVSLDGNLILHYPTNKKNARGSRENFGQVLENQMPMAQEEQRIFPRCVDRETVEIVSYLVLWAVHGYNRANQTTSAPELPLEPGLGTVVRRITHDITASQK